MSEKFSDIVGHFVKEISGTTREGEGGSMEGKERKKQLEVQSETFSKLKNKTKSK